MRKLCDICFIIDLIVNIKMLPVPQGCLTIIYRFCLTLADRIHVVLEKSIQCSDNHNMDFHKIFTNLYRHSCIFSFS